MTQALQPSSGQPSKGRAVGEVLTFRLPTCIGDGKFLVLAHVATSRK
jgi:hypothetical protein